MARTFPVAFPFQPLPDTAILVNGPGTVVRRHPASTAEQWLRSGHLVWEETTKRSIALVEKTPGGEKEVCLVVPPAPGVGFVGLRPVSIEEYRRTYADELATVTWMISELNQDARARFGPGAPQITLGGLEETSGVRRPRSNSAP